MQAPAPTHRYLTDPNDITPDTVQGPSRWIELPDGGAWQAQSVETQLQLPSHSLRAAQGSLSFWLVSLEDLRTVPPLKHIGEAQAGYCDYVLLSDQPRDAGWQAASFALVWASHWYPQLFAKFHPGNVYPDAYNPPKAVIGAGHFAIDRLRWYQMTLTWNRTAARYRLYANGVLITPENQFFRMIDQPCGDRLYLGNTALAFADLAFYDTELDAAQIQQIYDRAGPRHDPTLTAKLRQTYAGAPLNPSPGKATAVDPQDGWITALRLSLTDDGDLEQLYIQGNTDAVSQTHEGILLQTPDRPEGWKPPAPNEDPHQVYLWTRAAFEGDLDVSFEFKPLAHNGLLLLMAQASGMQGEDFMADYPLRTTGSMRVVYHENVRNYHWEFFREMDDARNDVASHVLVKNPWLRPLAYRCMDQLLSLNQWHRLRFVQVGAHLRATIDDQVIFDLHDDPDTHSGPVYRLGHVAIRAMIKTSALLRHLEVRTRLDEIQVQPLPNGQTNVENGAVRVEPPSGSQILS